jgi:hypothetical protein
VSAPETSALTDTNRSAMLVAIGAQLAHPSSHRACGRLILSPLLGTSLVFLLDLEECYPVNEFRNAHPSDQVSPHHP